MTLETFYAPLAGGLLVGLASAIFLLFLGRIAGISGILAGTVSGTTPKAARKVDAAFLAGLVTGGALLLVLDPAAFPDRLPRSLPVMALAGFLVGLGTRMGCGCTSGHGVCGMARLAPRSMVATVTFVAVGMATVTAVRLLGGAS